MLTPPKRSESKSRTRVEKEFKIFPHKAFQVLRHISFQLSHQTYKHKTFNSIISTQLMAHGYKSIVHVKAYDMIVHSNEMHNEVKT